MANLESRIEFKHSKKNIRRQYIAAVAIAASLTGLGYIADDALSKSDENGQQQESPTLFTEYLTVFGLGLGVCMGFSAYCDSRTTIIIDQDDQVVETRFNSEITNVVSYDNYQETYDKLEEWVLR